MKQKVFFQQLNRSQELQVQYKHWAGYREAITAYIIEHTMDMQKTIKVVIIGAGNVNDIDLRKLVNHFQEVVLTDIDLESMTRGQERQSVKGCLVKEVDYLGLGINQEGLYELDLNHEKAFDRYLDKCVKEINCGELALQTLDSDIIVVLPIYTQLFFGYIDNDLKIRLNDHLISEEIYFKCLHKLLEYMPIVIQSFNDGITSKLNENQKVIVFSDLLEDQPDGIYDQQYLIQNMDQAYERYVEQYGMGLGHYGLFHLEEKLNHLDGKWFRWPFSENRVLLVKGEVFCNSSSRIK